jgi:two-component system, OmpR family, response regulator RegX3
VEFTANPPVCIDRALWFDDVIMTAGQIRVLVVEDEPTLAESMRYGLEREGFLVSTAEDGPSALGKFQVERPDVVVLDLMLPDVPGEEVCHAIRRVSSVPIIIVSAKATEEDRVLGLDIGADDYLTKPFSARELIARIRALLRRVSAGPHSAPAVLRAGPVEIDVEAHEVRLNGFTVDLPPKEFMLLEYLVRHAGKLCLRESVIAAVWGTDYFGDTRTLDVHVKRLRLKIEAVPGRPSLLRTVRGLGYKFETGEVTRSAPSARQR